MGKLLKDFKCKPCDILIEAWVEQDEIPVCEECDEPMTRQYGFAINATSLDASAPSRSHVGGYKRGAYKLPGQQRAEY